MSSQASAAIPNKMYFQIASNVSQQHRQIINSDSNTDQLIMVVTLVCCCLSGAFSVAGNSMVLWIICRSKTFRHSATFNFIANICVSDILISTLVVPFQFQVHLLKRWLIPWFLCYACPAIQVLMVSNSVFTMTVIAIERYRAVLYPLKTRLTKGQVKIEIGIIWALSVFICIPAWFALKVQLESDPMTGQRTLAQCSSNIIQSNLYRQYNTLLIIVHYFVPLCLISYCYIRMAIVLNGNMNEMTEMINSRLYCKTVRRNKRKVVKMLFFVVFLFLVCWLPIQLVNICREIWPQLSEFRYFNVIKFACSWLALSSSSYNPYIYILYNEKFRHEFRRQFHYIYYIFCSVRNEKFKSSDSHQLKDSNKISY